MADIKKIKVGTTTYDIVDAGAARSSHTHSNYLTSHQDLSNYVTLNTDQTITGKKTFGPMKMSGGRWQNAGDDEGLIIEKASNGYAGVCLGDPGGIRSVFYLNSDNKATWRYCSAAGGATYDVSHPGKAGTIALTSDLSRSFSGTTGGNSGTAVAAVTGVTGNGTATALTGVKVSSSASAAPGGHTHSFTPAGTIELASSENSNSGYLKYAHSIDGGSYTLGGTKTFVTGVSGGSGNLVSYTTASGSTVQVSNGTRIPYITGTLSGTTLTLNTYYLSHAHNPASSSGTGTVSLSGSAPSLIYRYIKPTFTGTSSTSGANSGTNFNAATAVGSNGTATVLTGVKASGTANCAPAGHTHGYSGSTN